MLKRAVYLFSRILMAQNQTLRKITKTIYFYSIERINSLLQAGVDFYGIPEHNVIFLL